MHNLKQLKIWNGSVELATEVYKATDHFPKEERFGLTSQIRRSAVSIPSNVAEGAGRNGKGEFKHFLGIANGSAYELQTQLIIANRLELLNDKVVEPLLKEIDELQKMNYKLQLSMK
jgi:four helix bundle protein